MTQTQDFSGWAITITRTGYHGGELGDEADYTGDQIAAMRANLDELSEQAVNDAFPSAEIDFSRGSSDRISASYEGGAVPATDAHDIETWVKDTLDGVFNGGEWANL